MLHIYRNDIKNLYIFTSMQRCISIEMDLLIHYYGTKK